MPLDDDQVQVYKAIHEMIIKSVLVLVAIVAFFIVLFQLIHEKDATRQWIYAALDAGLLGGTTYAVYGHYFPHQNKPARVAKKK